MTDSLDKTFDLLIIGGGITGAGIALDASLRGLSVALVEKNSFASGTSSKSSKLIHGGIRYLEQGNFRLVFEACRERALLLKNAKQYVWPIAIALPVYSFQRRPAWQVKLGLWLYDTLALFRNVGNHQSLPKESLLKEFPGLRDQELRKGFLFYDAQMDDAALARQVMSKAQSVGCVAQEQHEVIGFIKQQGLLQAAQIRNHQNQQTQQITAKIIVNVTGPWIDRVRQMDDTQARPFLRPSKGVHIQFHKQSLPINKALLLFTPQDQRVFFVLPWKESILVGTTDTDAPVDPDKVSPESADIEYLLTAVNFYFPHAQLREKDIVRSFAGLRPLLRDMTGTPSHISREHFISESASGLLSMLGGKYTTFRKMAEELVDKVVKKLKKQGHVRPIKPCTTAKFKLD